MLKPRLKLFWLPLLFVLILLVGFSRYMTSEEQKEMLVLPDRVKYKEAALHEGFKSLTHIRNLQQTRRKWSAPSRKNGMARNQEIWKDGGEKYRVSAKGLARNGFLDDPSRVFRIVSPFSFPQPTFSRPSAELLHSYWVRELQIYLQSIRGKELSLVTSTVEHTQLLLNWLVAAYVKIDPPLENVLVLSMDYHLHSSLTRRNISSLYVHKNSVIAASAHVNSVFSQVHVVRMAVLRLMNHYGYDVVNYDCDAVLLKNPRPLFEKYNEVDLIGTFGKGPNDLYLKWGVTLNTGVMLMRSNPNMGEYQSHKLDVVREQREVEIMSGNFSQLFVNRYRNVDTAI